MTQGAVQSRTPHLLGGVQSKAIETLIVRIAHLQERLSPVSEMSAVGEFTTKKVREHLRELTAIVGEMAMDVKELMNDGS